jgi:hypothetical protein
MQSFDSGAECYLQLIIKNSLEYINQIISTLADHTPVIVLELLVPEMEAKVVLLH